MRTPTASMIADAILRRLPALTLHVNENDMHVDWSIDIPRQSGLAFECRLDRQSDELHLHVGSFWLEWYPAEDDSVRALYIEAVCGLLSGEYRIREYVRRGKGVGGELHAPNGEGWKTIGNSSSTLLPRNWFSTTRIIQNRPTPAGTDP